MFPADPERMRYTAALVMTSSGATEITIRYSEMRAMIL